MKKALLSLLFYLSVLSLKAQEVRGRYEPDMDEEEVADHRRMEGFHFTNFETWGMIIGAALLLIGWVMIKQKENTSKDSGCLPQGMMILGIILIFPLIIGILGVVNKIIYYGLIIASIAFGIWVIFTLFEKNK
jgi:hypothetical protein